MKRRLTLKKIRLTCKKISCSKCFKKSISQAAQKSTLRMMGFIAFLVSDFGIQEKRVFNHGVVSIPKALYGDMADTIQRKKIEKRILVGMKTMKIRGGTMVYHPFRFTPNLRKAYFSPHYHFIISGYTEPEAVIQFHKKTKCAYVAFGAFSDQGRLFHTLRYLLSHCGILQDKHAVKYFGLCHNTKFKLSEILSNAVDSVEELHDILNRVMSPFENKVQKNDLQFIIRKSTLKSLEVQEIILKDSGVGIIDKRRKIIVSGDGEFRDKLFGLCVDESIVSYDVDNAPKPKSVLEIQKNQKCVLISAVHDVEKLRYNYKDGQYYKEKCYTKSMVNVIMVNDSTIDLCKICNFKMRNLIITNEDIDISKIWLVSPNFDEHDPVMQLGDVPLDQTCLTNGSELRYLDFSDLNYGIPYYNEKEGGGIELRYDNKILHYGPFYDYYHKAIKEQVDQVQQLSKERAIKKHCKNLIFSGNSKLSLDELIAKYEVRSYSVTLKKQKKLIQKNTHSVKLNNFF